MTVAFAIRFDGGVLLASDSAASDTTFHFTVPYQRKKIRTFGQCAVAIAGNADFGWHIVESIGARHTNDAKSLSRAIARKCRRRHSEADGDAQFIVADSGNVRLLHAQNRFKVSPRGEDGYVPIGRAQVAGYYLTRYWHEGVSREYVERLAALCILETAATVQGVDSRLQMAVITDEGPSLYPSSKLSPIHSAAIALSQTISLDIQLALSVVSV